MRTEPSHRLFGRCNRWPWRNDGPGDHDDGQGQSPRGFDLGHGGRTARVLRQNHLDLVLEGFGHGQLTAPCVDRVMAQFVARASVEGLDVSCLRAARPLPFFTSLNGPPP